MISSRRWCIFLALCLLHSASSVPVTPTEPSLIITSDAPSSSSTSGATSESSVTPEVSSTTATSPSSTTDEWTSTVDPKNDVRYKPKITSMHVESNVTLRYAKTLVTSKVANPDTKANEVTFSVVIPETAFITAFSMEIDGKVYDAYVKEKDEAKKEYQSAVSSGIAAAHVAVKARDSNHFTVSVNVEPQKKAIFRLYYEELLSRRLGLYNLVMNLSPGQLVDDFVVDVDIKETVPITAVHVPGLRTGNEIDADPSDAPNQYAKHTISEDKLNAKVHFSPNKDQQLELMKSFKEREKPTPQPVTYYSPFERPPKPLSDEDGIKGQFVVQYDVDRDTTSELMINDGYFVHFFAPKGLKPLNKHVVFVLDVSGSMAGRKINQLKEAMFSILEDLNPGDYFSIIDFHYSAKVYNLEDSRKNVIFRSSTNYYPWEDYDNEDTSSKSETLPPPYSVTKENIDKAKAIIKSLDARGGTNIYDALTTALKVANTGIQASQTLPESSEEPRLPEPLVIFLTDGDPTVGETNTEKILTTVKEMNPKKVAIFSLAFGEDADRGFLRRVALQNSGFLRHIYEAADAALQLRHFFRLVASPLLSNVTFIYPKEQIDEGTLTKKVFEHYFMGSELVIAGKISGDLSGDIPLKLHGKSFSGPIDFIPIVPEEKKRTNFWPLERMWAYISIKQLLDEKDEKGGKAEDLTDPDSPAKKALDLALKYSFVTPLTSLVVVKPNSTAAVDAESVDASGADDRGYALPLIAGGSAASFNYMTTPFVPQSMLAQRSYMSRPASLAGLPGHSGVFAKSSSRFYVPISSGLSFSLPQAYSASGFAGASYGPISGSYRPLSGSYGPISTRPARPMFAPTSPALPGKPQPLWLSAAAAVALGGLASNNHLPHQQKLGKSARNYNFDGASAPFEMEDSFFPSQISFDQTNLNANKKYTTMLPARRAGPPAYTTTFIPSAHFSQVDTAEESSFAIAQEPSLDITKDDTDVSNSQTTSASNVTEGLIAKTNTTTEATVTKVTVSVERLKAYGLDAYPWVKEYLEASEDAVSLPLPDKKTLKYKLRKQSDTYEEPTKLKSCTNSVGGGEGVCQYLLKCKDLSKGFADLNTYLNHSCDAEGYAGICCKTTNENP